MGVMLKLAGGTACLALIVGGSVLLGATSSASQCGGTVDPAAAAEHAPISGYKGDQLANAAAIMNAASSMGLDARAQSIGVMTAIGESSLKNLTYGDEGQGVTNPDGSPTTSVGLFQQQDWWGSRADRLDPTKAASMFYARMITVAGWETLAPTEVAHEVQGNANPNHYTRSWEPAEKIVTELGASGSGGGGCGSTVYPLNQGYSMTDDYGPRGDTGTGASTWHPAIDIGGACGDPVFASQQGTVTGSDRLSVDITHPDGYVISYLHTHKWERLVKVGDTVTAGQQLAVIGNEAPSTGCHLDVRIDVTKNTNPDVAALPRSETLGGRPGFVNPERFYEVFGLDICPTDWCKRTY